MLNTLSLRVLSTPTSQAEDSTLHSIGNWFRDQRSNVKEKINFQDTKTLKSHRTQRHGTSMLQAAN